MIDGSAQGSMASLKGRQMAAVRTQHTAPEIAVRKAMHARGLRFRLHRRDLPGRPDIVLAKHRTAVFVHGCTLCDRGTRRPKSNAGFWSAKLDENRRRDARNTAELTRLGWRVVVVWECETRIPGRLGPDRLGEVLDRILSYVPSTGLNDG